MKQSKKKETMKASSWNVRCRSDDFRVASSRFQDVVTFDLCVDVNLSCSEDDLMKLLCCHLGRQTESRSVTFVLRIFCVRVCSCFCILPHPTAVKPVWGLATYFRSLATGPSAVDYHIRVRNTVLFTERLTALWTRLSAAPCYSVNLVTHSLAPCTFLQH